MQAAGLRPGSTPPPSAVAAEFRDHTGSASDDVHGAGDRMVERNRLHAQPPNLSATKDIWRSASDLASVVAVPNAVLVAEPEPETREYLGRQLRDDGFDVLGAARRSEALELAVSARPGHRAQPDPRREGARREGRRCLCASRAGGPRARPAKTPRLRASSSRSESRPESSPARSLLCAEHRRLEGSPGDHDLRDRGIADASDPLNEAKSA